MQPLRVSESRRFLVHGDGTPFFWLGDTAWELFHKLNREEANHYLTTRAEQGFTVVQAVALAEFDGIRTGNAYGHRPLLQHAADQYDPAQPDERGGGEPGTDGYGYWEHADYIVRRAEELGLYIALLPTWGDKFNLKWGKGPELFTAANALAYGQWLGRRYAAAPNILWVLGGDRPLENEAHMGVVRNMAQGLREGDGGAHLATFHPPGGKSSSQFVHEEVWIDFHMIQTGHGRLDIPTYRYVQDDYGKSPVRPVLDGEPRYEDHPIGFKPENGFFRDFDCRQAAYWGVFAGGFGHTYGHHSVWSMNTEPGEYFTMHWREAIQRPGAAQMRFLRALIESRPFFERVPDQSLLVDERDGADHIRATRGDSYAFFYTPTGAPIEVNLGRVSGDRVAALWYDPRSGAVTALGERANEGRAVFTPPAAGRGEDWVLVLDDSSHGYPPPGTVA